MQLAAQQEELRTPISLSYTPSFHVRKPAEAPPPLNIVIHVVGSQGDVQTFLEFGRELKYSYGHRKHSATQEMFRTFVEEKDLEFFNIGGDPAEPKAFMVKNSRLIPG